MKNEEASHDDKYSDDCCFVVSLALAGNLTPTVLTNIPKEPCSSKPDTA